ncbi:MULTISPECIES: hypothetical protein [Streptomyces]|uniref:hypothetical protein n=1 Tax=Streptomyces TaxID=1883 RepID=UPI00345FB468
MSMVIDHSDDFAGVGAPLVITDQTPAAQAPGRSSSHDPATGQDLKAADVVAAADDTDIDPELRCTPVDEMAG